MNDELGWIDLSCFINQYISSKETVSIYKSIQYEGPIKRIEKKNIM